MVPPPQWFYVDPRSNPSITPISNSPKIFLFVIQRKSLKFPQIKFLHLVTLFPVCLRVLPFSELLLKKFQTLKLPKFHPIPHFLALSRRPIIKGLRPDLILSVTRLL
jgi:hypothetical protein